MKKKRTAAVTPLLAFAAAMATRDRAAAARAVRRGRTAGLRRVAFEETALMLILHAGFPAALEGMLVLQTEWPGRPRAGAERDSADWLARGAKTCARVYGRSYPKLVAGVWELHPDLASMMIEIGYGRMLSRPGLDGRARELAACAVLAALGWERQLVSHLLGALRFGASRGQALAAARIGARAGGLPVKAAFEGARRTAFGTR